MITVVTATGLEYAAARKVLPPTVRVVQAGIAMNRSTARIDGIAISCGLAGGLRPDLPTGTVLIPRTVRRPGGTTISCDPQVVDALMHASRAVGCEPVDAPLLGSANLIFGSQREVWAAQGYAGADMESGLIAADRIACVRVILDTPSRELSPAWEKPASVLFQPRAWLDLPFLSREGPRCAALAASVVEAYVKSGDDRSSEVSMREPAMISPLQPHGQFQRQV